MTYFLASLYFMLFGKFSQRQNNNYQWHPTPVLLPGKSHGQRSLVGCRPPSMGSQTVGHDSATSLSLFTFMHWRRKWQPTPVFLPGESQGLESLVGCRLWGRTELDTTEVTQQQQNNNRIQTNVSININVSSCILFFIGFFSPLT